MRILSVALLAILAIASVGTAQARRLPAGTPDASFQRWKRNFLRDYERRLNREMNRVRAKMVKEMSKSLDAEYPKLHAAWARNAHAPRRVVPKEAPRATTPLTSPAARRQPGFLGVRIGELSDIQRKVAGIEKGGLLIASVVEGSGAAKAGVKGGDVLLKVDGRPIEGFDALREALGKKRAGDKVSLLISRDGAQRFIDARLAARQTPERTRPARPDRDRPEPARAEEAPLPAAKAGWLGIFLADDFTGRERPSGEPLGIEIEETASGGPAAKAGLKAGDILLKIDGKPLANYEALRKALGGAKAGKRIVVELRRGDALLRLKVQLGVKKGN